MGLYQKIKLPVNDVFFSYIAYLENQQYSTFFKKSFWALETETII